MTAHCFPNLSRGLGIERPADQRRAAAQLNTLNLCLHSPMMCPIKRGMGGFGKMTLLRKICLSFLDTQGCRRKGMLSHIAARSFPSLSWTQKERKIKLSGCVPSLSAGRPRGRARRKRETRLPFPAPKPSALANEKRHCPTRFVGRRRGCPDPGTECDGRCSENTKRAKIASMMFGFSDLPSN